MVLEKRNLRGRSAIVTGGVQVLKPRIAFLNGILQIKQFAQ